MYRFEFKEDDLFINRLKTYPEYNVSIYMGKTFINKDRGQQISGGLNVFDISRNKDVFDAGNTFVFANSRKDLFRSQVYQPLVDEYLGNNYYTQFYASQ